MSFADFYFEKYKYFPAIIDTLPSENLKFIIIIPCFNEPDIIKTLQSIKNNKEIISAVEIIVLINSSEDCYENIKTTNLNTYNQLSDWCKDNSQQNKNFFVLNIENLPSKIAGAGLARKIAMDEALRRFNLIENKNGFIISLDADTICDINYLSEIENEIEKHRITNGFTINFEHPISGNEFNHDIYSAIILYELYLRYYIQSLKFTGFPYAFYTIGSAFGVRAEVYAKQGGMNTKQAGEDFYFLHKIIPLGKFYEINSTTVYPSPRISDRVPFGTGVVINKIINEPKSCFLTYNFEAFIELKHFFDLKDYFFESKTKNFDLLSQNIQKFLNITNFYSDLSEIKRNSPNINTFYKRFFQWFDAFRVLKFLNFVHENAYEKKNITEQSVELLDKLNINYDNTEAEYLLQIFRKLK